MKASATDLIGQLLEDPERFCDEGLGYQLLQAYFSGHDIETLKGLLGHEDQRVQREAMFVVSELGERAIPLIDDVIPLLTSGDRKLKYEALEVLAVCGEGERASEFVHVVSALDSDDDVIRALAMRLMSRADNSQLIAARRNLRGDSIVQLTHARGLSVMIESLPEKADIVASMIRDQHPLVRRYGAVAAARLRATQPHLFAEVGRSDDIEIRKFHTVLRNLDSE